MTAGTSHLLSRRRMHPVLRRVAIGTFIVLLPFAVHAVWDHVELRRLVREVELIRAKGEGITPAEVGRGDGPLSAEQTRAARYYLAAAMLAIQPAPKVRGALAEMRQVVTGERKVRLDPAEMLRRLNEILAGEQDALTLLDKATTLDFAGFPPGTNYSYRTSELLALSDLSAARSARLSLNGDSDRAADSAITSLRIRRVDDPRFSRGGSEIPMVLSFSRPSADMLRRLQAALEMAESPDRLLQGQLLQRALYLDEIFRRYYGSDPRAPGNYTLPMRSVTETAWRPWFTHGLVDQLQTCADLLDAVRKPWPDKVQAITDASSRHSRVLRSRVPFGLTGMGEVFSAADALVLDRGARVALAIERFTWDHGDALPPTLAALVPTYLKSVPDDPISGRSLMYRQDADSYTIYGVGKNGKDDGGDLTSEYRENYPGDWGQRLLHGHDVGVRILSIH